MPAQRGIALVIVLWMLALLTVIANSMVYSLRADVQVAANGAAVARAEAVADAGVFKAIQELTRPPGDPYRWQGDGVVHDWRFAEAALQIAVLDEAAKIDLNTAPDILLLGLFRSLGVDEAAAASLADAVVDWRDPDDVRRLNGAEKEDYLAAGKDTVPKNRDFETIEELRLVLGMTDELFARIAPLVTVNSRRPGVDSTVAPRGVLLALPGASPELVDAYLAQRQAQLLQGQGVPPAPFAQTATAGRVGNTFSIQVHAVLGDNTNFLREAVVQITGSLAEPFAILAWRAPSGGAEPQATNTTDRTNHQDGR